jgi:GH18 family chitinase
MDALVNTPSAWGAFASNVKSFCARFGLAGVDLDWEPTAQPGFTVTSAQIHNFGNLVKTIKRDDPGLTLTAEGVGDPVKLSTSAGVKTGASAYMLDATAIKYLDDINVEAYPVKTAAKADSIIRGWAAYVTGAQGQKDVDGNVPSGHARQLQYGLNVSRADSPDHSPGVVESKVDATIHRGYGGLFVFELDSDTGSPSTISRISTEIAKDRLGSGIGRPLTLAKP